MSSECAIRVEGLSKRYRLGRRRERYRTLRESVVTALGAPFRGRDDRPPEEHWALRNVSFEVKRGQAVGIIGRNGAGKSTLLKVLARITEPTAGFADIVGRVGSLLEVGSGFHPELTGRENILLNGAILGMRRAEILRKFDEIVAFAEVERFIDTPVKHYSSGMYLRLAFAVAAHLEPEILVVDEVLAVGDLEFQRKCLGKMGEISRTGGRTVLFVSHNLAAVTSLCSEAVLLEGGEVRALGPVRDVVGTYVRGLSEGGAGVVRWDDAARAPGGDAIRLRSVATRIGDATAAEIPINQPFEIEFEFRNQVAGQRCVCSINVSDSAGTCVFASMNAPAACAAPADPWHGREYPVGVFRTAISMPAHFLNAGDYSVRIVVLRDTSLSDYLLDVEDAIRFTITEDGSERGGFFGHWKGVTRPRLRWNSQQVEGAT